MPCLLVMTPFVYRPPVIGPGFRRHPFSKGSLSRPQINLLKVPALFPFSCHSFPLVLSFPVPIRPEPLPKRGDSHGGLVEFMLRLVEIHQASNNLLC